MREKARVNGHKTLKECLIMTSTMVFLLNLAYATTTTVNPLTPINTSEAKSLPYMFTYSFAIPYFFIGMVILIVGIVGIRTRRADLSILSGLISSMLFYLVIPSTSILYLAGTFGFLTFIAVLERLMVQRRIGKKESL